VGTRKESTIKKGSHTRYRITLAVGRNCTSVGGALAPLFFMGRILLPSQFGLAFGSALMGGGKNLGFLYTHTFTQ